MKLFLLILSITACGLMTKPVASLDTGIRVGAENLEAYLPQLSEKRVAVVANQTSVIGNKHIVDVLISKGINLVKIFSPEHGFRGKADAGEKVQSGIDHITGLPLISLYGKEKKPSSEALGNVDVIVFDIQDVGVRFYTYISTLHYVMEACAENGKSIIVLDRPNPNAHYIDGPILEPEKQSFIGMHPVPVVYGMTIGEYAKMIQGERWINQSETLELSVVPCTNYNHQMIYDLPIKPSPNLPNLKSILLYPSLCFFEGTNVSIGRGTDKQFQVIGTPLAKQSKTFSFTPKPNEGAKYPKLENIACYGEDLSVKSIEELHSKSTLDLSYLMEYRELFRERDEDFFLENLFFDKLAGNTTLRSQIDQGMAEKEIRVSWQNGIESFKKIRSKYLLYSEN